MRLATPQLAAPPSPNGQSRHDPDDRDRRGRFVRGNRGGPGNPRAKRTEQVRGWFLERITEADFDAILRVLLAKALAGDLDSIRMVLDRTMGRVSDERGGSAGASFQVLILPDDPARGERADSVPADPTPYTSGLPEWKAVVENL